MTALIPRPMTTSFEQKVFQRLEDLGLSMSELAERLGLPEPELRQLCHQGDPPLSRLEALAQHLRVPLAYFQHNAFNVVGVGNTQKIKIGKAAAHELAAQLGVCRLALEQAQQLVAAKDEIIALLRSGNGPSTL